MLGISFDLYSPEHIFSVSIKGKLAFQSYTYMCLDVLYCDDNEPWDSSSIKYNEHGPTQLTELNAGGLDCFGGNYCKTGQTPQRGI